MEPFPAIDLTDTTNPASVASAIKRANETLAGTADTVTVCSHLADSWFRQKPPGKAAEPSAQLDTLRELLLESRLPEDIRDGIAEAFIRHQGPDVRVCGADGGPSQHQHQHQQQTFAGFAELPAELRLKIWEAATPSRTLVDPKATTIRGSGKVSLNRYLAVPRLAQVCREARDVVFEQSSRTDTAPVAAADKFSDLVLPTDILDLRNSEMCSVFAQPSPYLTILPLFKSLAFNLNGLSWELRSIALSDLEKLPSLAVVTQTIVFYLPSHRSSKDHPSGLVHQFVQTGGTKWLPGIREPGIRELDPEDIPFWHTWRTTENFPAIGEKHITKIVHLADRAAVREMLDLGAACWTTGGGRARFDAVCRQATVFCMDCRAVWWEKRDRAIAEYRLLSGLFDDEKPDHVVKESIFPGRWMYDLKRDHPWVQRTLGRLPELKPAVRFIVGFDNYFPDIDYWAHLRQRYA